jgi:hypothetical protein
MTTYTYADEYLKNHVTDARELRATIEVQQHGVSIVEWVTRLVILRAYIITCMECMKSDSDTFAAKLTAYRNDYKDALSQARAAQNLLDAAAGKQTGGGSMFTVPIERA